MKALWPSTLIALASSSPAAWAQDRAAPPAGGAPGAPATAPAATAPAAAAPPTGTPPASAPSEPTPSEAVALDEPIPSAAEPATPDAGEPAAPPAPGSPSPEHALFATTPATEEPAAESKPAAPGPSEAPAPKRPESSNLGHFRLGARAGLVAPFGTVAQGTQLLDVATMGAGYGLDLSFGVAEEVTIGAYGDLLVLDRTPACEECAPLSYGAGLLIRYHLAQGLRFDPWASYGLGVIGLTGTPPAGEGSYFGLEWMRLSFGGDWYATPNLGLGPYVELGAGSFWAVPEGETAGGVHLRFQMGMRIVLDLPGR